MDRDFNLLVVEAKARASTSSRDVRKVQALTEITGAFGYALGVYLHVQNRPCRVLQTGKVQMSITGKAEMTCSNWSGRFRGSYWPNLSKWNERI